jgi:hypothetical protein
MFYISLMVLGLIAAFKLPLEQFPALTAPFIYIELPYAGASPEEVERTIVRPAEEALATLSGVKNMWSNARGDGGASEDGGVATRGGGGRLHVVQRAADIEVDVGVAGGGDAAHTDAVDLHAGVERIGIGGVGATAAEVGLDAVVEVERALVVARVAALVVDVEAGAAVCERLPTQRAGVTAKIAGAALAELFDLGVEGVEAQAEAREQRLVHVD